MNHKKFIIIVVGLVVALMVGSFAVLATQAGRFFEAYRHDIAGLAVEVDEFDIDWLSYGVRLKGVNIYPAGKENKPHLLASADEIRVGLVPHDLLRRMVHVRKLTLIRPRLDYVRISAKHTNWEALNMSWLKDDEPDKGSLGNWRLRVDEIRIRDGLFAFRDRTSGGRFELTRMDARVSHIVDEPDPHKLPSKVSVDGMLADYSAPVRVRGRMNILAEGLNFEFSSSIANAPVTYFSPFYAGQVPFPITAGTIGVKSEMRAVKSYLNSTHHAAISGLKVGGVHGGIINPLFLRRKTIHVTATVNGDLEGGNLRVSSQVSRIIGDSILADARAAAPLEKVGDGVKRAGEKTGGAVRRLFRRR